MIYFDYSATTPMSAYAMKTYQEIATNFFANSMSHHREGLESDEVLSISRRTIAATLNATEDEIYFTGSGSEATFLALTGLALANKQKGKTILTTKGEHHSVSQALGYLHQQHGFTIEYIPVNEYGEVTPHALEHALTDHTCLVSIAHANSEIGTVQDLSSLGHLLAKHDILFHSDCVQTFGKLPIPIDSVSSISISAHKCYGPKGVGAAYIRQNIAWTPFLEGTTHEKGFRAGTVDVPAIAAFAAAIEDYAPLVKEDMERLNQLRDSVVHTFQQVNDLVFEGHPHQRLPFHIALRMRGIEGQLLMLECNKKGMAISTGSACRVGESHPSKTLLAIGRTTEEAHELIRITFGRYTTSDDVQHLIHTLQSLVALYKGGSIHLARR